MNSELPENIQFISMGVIFQAEFISTESKLKEILRQAQDGNLL